MKKEIHYADDIRGFYLNTVELDVPENFKLPSNATLESVPTIQAGKKARLTSNKTWEIVDDPDLKTVYDENGDKKLISIYETGNYSDLPKPSKDATLINSKWVTELELREQLFTSKYNSINTYVSNQITSGFSSDATGVMLLYDTSLTDQFEIDQLERKSIDAKIKATGADGIKRRYPHTASQIRQLKQEFFQFVFDLKLEGDEKKEYLRENYKLIDQETSKYVMSLDELKRY